MSVVVNSLDQLIDQLHEVFEEDRVNVEHVHALMKSYKSETNEWKKYAKFDRHRYTRNLVDSGNGKFNLMLLCWGEGHGSSIHDHSDSHCFMKVLQGELWEMRFAWPDEKDEKDENEEDDVCRVIRPTGQFALRLDDVCYINDSLGLHRVENRNHSDTAVSLHLYCPPFDACHVFDQRTGHKTKCPVTFWSQFGHKTNAVTCTSLSSSSSSFSSSTSLTSRDVHQAK